MQLPPKVHTLPPVHDENDADLWADYLNQQPSATIYHDLAWREIFGDGLGYRSYPLIAIDPGSGKPCGVLPLYLVPSLVGRSRLVAVPFRDRGGALFDHAAALHALVAEAKSLAREVGAGFVEIKTIDPYPALATEAAGLDRIEHWVHSEIDLSNLTLDGIGTRQEPKMRNVRKAESEGLGFAEAPVTPQSLAQWYRLYGASQRDLGLPPFAKRFFDRMLTRLAPRGLAHLFFVCRRDETPVAGVILFRDRGRAIYAYSASEPAHRGARPNDLMLYRLIEWLLARGVGLLDLGADSPAQDGLLQFKRKWRARQKPIPYYYLGSGSPTATDSSEGRFSVVRRIVRHVPLPVARAALVPLVRYFG